MNEMDLLSRFRAEIPLAAAARAEESFRTALAEELSPERHSAPRFRNRFRELRPAWRVAIAVPLALGLAAGVTVAVLPSGPTVLTATLLADRAAAAALTDPNVPAEQWIYVQSEFSTSFKRPLGGPNPAVRDGWMTADGTMNYGSAGSSGDPIFPYNKIDSLPRDPAALNRYFRSLDPVKSDDNSSVEFGKIREMLFAMVMPPWLEAEMYHALALIPGVQVRQNVKDIAGRAGVAFLLPPTKQSEQMEVIVDASDYHLLAWGSWDNPSHSAPDSEDAILQEYPVAELGSAQPSTTPPSAAGLAAEKIFFYEEYLYYTPKINHVAPGQWLYRDLRTGGKDQEIWATADDSAQAVDVNGTLTVCHRTDPCAASEQWLMPAGPSYSLVYPQYPQPSRTAIKQYIYNFNHHIKATSPFKQVKQPPTLPPLPRPLLDKLNTYSTGCADVADDCNAVNVAANVLTGYGNYPELDSSWFLALADVPGVSVQHITDAAGNQDIEFTFPSQDGVTGILVNASLLNKGEVQYEGYVRDGQQTLVLNQALVSGPGVLPGK